MLTLVDPRRWRCRAREECIGGVLGWTSSQTLGPVLNAPLRYHVVPGDRELLAPGLLAPITRCFLIFGPLHFTHHSLPSFLFSNHELSSRPRHSRPRC